MELATIERYQQFLEANDYSASTITSYIRTIRDLQEPPLPGSPALLVEFVAQSLLQKKNILSDSNFNTETLNIT